METPTRIFDSLLGNISEKNYNELKEKYGSNMDDVNRALGSEYLGWSTVTDALNQAAASADAS